MIRLILPKKIIIALLAPVIAMLYTSLPAHSEEPGPFQLSNSIKSIKFSDQLKVRGLEISDGIYMGQAKVGGKYGLGFVIERKAFSWGINHRGLSITKRF